MSNRAWMPLGIDDYLADTGHLTPAEHGAYLLLIMHYWKHDGLPKEERLIARITRLTPDQWAESRDVLVEFFDDGWSHKRINAELAKADAIIEKRKAAANARYQSSKGTAHAGAHAEQEQSKSTDTGVPPLTDNHQKEEPNGSSKKRGSRLPPDFQPDLDFAVGLGLSRSQAENESIKFREWWPAQPGQKGVKLDWGLTWQTWCRKALERMPSARGSPERPRSTLDAAYALMTRLNDADRPNQDNRPDQPLALGFSANR